MRTPGGIDRRAGSVRHGAMSLLPRTKVLAVPVALLAAASGCGASSGGDPDPGPGPAVQVAVVPPTARVDTGGTVSFQATVTGSLNTAVLWSVSEATGGTVTQAGRYTAPGAAGVFHVVATSAADGTRSAAAVVTVTAPPTGGPAALPLLARVGNYQGSPAAVVDLGAGRQALLVAWQSDGTAYDAAVRGWLPGVPATYTVETAPAATGPWTSRATVASTPRTSATANTLSSRQHVIAAAGDRYLRLRITSGATDLTRLDVFDAGGGTDDDFIIFGDSITEFAGEIAAGTSISDRIGTLTGGAHRPFVQKAGIAYDMYAGAPPASFDTDARQRLADYLPLFPGRYVGLAYGTNDSVNDAAEVAEFKAALRTCLDLVLGAGKVPLVATIPWAAGQSTTVARNQHIAEVLAEPAYAGRWIAGPDLYGFFSLAANRHYLTDNDGLHPSAAGNEEWRRLWAEAIVAGVYGQ